MTDGMLRALYDWTLSLAARKSAERWLAVIAFVESSIFLVPADVLFLPMSLAKPARAYRYALVATLDKASAAAERVRGRRARHRREGAECERQERFDEWVDHAAFAPPAA